MVMEQPSSRTIVLPFKKYIYIFRTNQEKEEKNYTMQYNMVMVVKKSFSDHCGKNYN